MNSRFCETVVRSAPPPKRSAKSAAASSCSPVIRPRKYAGANIAKSGLPLGMNAGVIAEYVVGHVHGHAGQQLEIQPGLQFRQKTLGCPTLFHKEILHARAIATLAQALLIAKDFCYLANHAKGLIGKDEGVEADSQVRFVGEPAAHVDRIANLAVCLRRRGRCR